MLQYLWTWLCVFLREISKNEKGKSHNSWNRATELKTFNLIALTIHYEAIWICSINDEVSSWEAKPRILETFSYSDQPQTYTFFAEDQNALSSVKALCVYLDSQNYFFPGCGKWVSHFSLFHSFFWPFLWWLILISFVSLSMTKSVFKRTLIARWLKLFTDDSDQTICGMERVHKKPAFYHIKRLQLSQVSTAQQIIFLERNMF